MIIVGQCAEINDIYVNIDGYDMTAVARVDVLKCHVNGEYPETMAYFASNMEVLMVKSRENHLQCEALRGPSSYKLVLTKAPVTSSLCA